MQLLYTATPVTAKLVLVYHHNDKFTWDLQYELNNEAVSLLLAEMSSTENILYWSLYHILSLFHFPAIIVQGQLQNSVPNDFRDSMSCSRTRPGPHVLSLSFLAEQIVRHSSVHLYSLHIQIMIKLPRYSVRNHFWCRFPNATTA